MASTTSADFPPAGSGPSLNRSAAGTFAAKIGAAILLYGTSVLVGRFLGPDGSGLLGVVQVGAEIAVAAAALGTPFAAAYYGSRRPRHGPALLGNGLLFSAILGVVFVAVAVALSGTISDVLDRPRDARLWAVAALLVPVTMLHHWLANLLRARRDFRRYNRLLLGTQAGTLVLTIVLLGVFDLGAVAAVLTLIGGRLVLVLGALPILARDGVALSARLFRASVRYGMRLQAATWSAWPTPASTSCWWPPSRAPRRPAPTTWRRRWPTRSSSCRCRSGRCSCRRSPPVAGPTRSRTRRSACAGRSACSRSACRPWSDRCSSAGGTDLPSRLRSRRS
jgi:hypothetical protein